MRLNQTFHFFSLSLFLLIGIIFANEYRTIAAAPLDYDGDGKSDLIVVRFDNPDAPREWHILQSSDGYRVDVFGRQNFEFYMDVDFDGDGVSDIASAPFGPNEVLKNWWIYRSSDNTLVVKQFGLSETDISVPQDYDGDGITDFCIRRFGTWWIEQSSDGTIRVEEFGTASNTALRGGDYDGDGKADLAISVGIAPTIPGGPQPRFLYVKRSTDGNWDVFQVGDGRTTALVTGDYDGDGISDVAAWQGNLWVWIRSSDGNLDGVRFGALPGDVPVQGDYDGDGKTDPAVYRRGNGINPQSTFHILASSDGYSVIPFGTVMDASAGTFSQRRYLAAAGF